MAICPCCHQTIRASKKAKATELEPLRLDTSELSDREVYAYYKRTARREDLNFKIRNLAPWVSTDLRESYLQLRESLNSGQIAEREVVKRLESLDNRWRVEALRLDYLARMFADATESAA